MYIPWLEVLILTVNSSHRTLQIENNPASPQRIKLVFHLHLRQIQYEPRALLIIHVKAKETHKLTMRYIIDAVQVFIAVLIIHVLLAGTHYLHGSCFEVELA